MNKGSQSHTMELIEKAKEIGLLESNLTINCLICCAIFPKEYENCPQCNTSQVQLNYVGLVNDDL